MIPVMSFVLTHILEGKRAVEILTDITTSIVLKNESASWVIEEIFGHIDNEVINDCNTVASLNHLHELVVRNLSWWSLEWNLLSSIPLMPDLSNNHNTVEPGNGNSGVLS